MANDFSVDELNAQLQKTNDLLKSAEKRFEDLLKIVNNLQKTGGKAPMYGSDATTEIFKRAEKKTTEFNKQMDKMYKVRQLLIDAEYDRVGDLEKERQERTRQFILERRKTAEMVEDSKTRRKEMSLQAKRIEMIGRMASGAGGGLAGFIGMGVGTGVARLAEGGGTVAKKSEGLQERILNYQRMAGTQETSAIGTPTGRIQSKMLSRLEKISPKLANIAYGKEGDDGERKGGALGKGAGAVGKMGGMLGLAGGIGGGLLGGAIMKGLESSPMFQAISKIMSTAFNLILRPIGDFFSAVFKPISIVLMKWGAINLRKWAQSMNDGTNEIMNTAALLGKTIVTFFDDPIGVLGKAFEQLAEYIRVALDPLTDKVEPIFANHVNAAYKAIDDRLTEELGQVNGALASGAGVVSGIGNTATKVEEKLDGYFDLYADHMRNVIVPNMTEEQKKGYAKFEGTEWAKSSVGQATGLFDKEGNLLKEEFALLGEELAESSKTVGEKAKDASTSITDMSKVILEEQKVTNEALAVGSEASINSAKVLEEGYNEIKRRLDALIRSQISARTKYVDGRRIEGKPDGDLVRTQKLLRQEGAEVDYLNYARDKINRYESATAGSFGVGVETFKTMQRYISQYKPNNPSTADWYNAKKLAKEMEKAKGMGNYNFLAFSNVMNNNPAYSGLSVEQAGAKYYGLAAFANGGIISEPVFGIGRSGRSYLLGENGAERVSPLNSSRSEGVVVNINIAKMSNDIDLQQIKPIVERAILETHARRGII